jgi:hypothetical protein
MSAVRPMGNISRSGVVETLHAQYHEQYVEELVGVSYYEHPHSIYGQPVYSEISGTEMVGVVFAVVAWDRYLANLLPTGVKGIHAVLQNTCEQSYTYVINGDMVR